MELLGERVTPHRKVAADAGNVKMETKFTAVSLKTLETLTSPLTLTGLPHILFFLSGVPVN